MADPQASAPEGERATTCSSHARWESKEQAVYVADQLEQEFLTQWAVVPHGDHFHAVDTGVPYSDDGVTDG